MSASKKPLSVALYGMDERSRKTMVMYLRGPCKGKAVVVSESQADIDIVDIDFVHSQKILAERQSKTPDRPVIVLSLDEALVVEGCTTVKKPIEVEKLLKALVAAEQSLKKKEKKASFFSRFTAAGVADEKKVSSKPEKKAEKIKKPVSEPQASNVGKKQKKKKEVPQVDKKQSTKRPIDTDERKKVSKHRTAKDLTESGFATYIGHVESVDFTDREQVLKASYHSKEFFLGYVQSALKVARAKARILQLNSGWKPLIIFPMSNEIWLDVSDKQLRAFAGIAIKKSSDKKVTLSAVDKQSTQFSEKMENFYDMDAFMWKLAIWTSKGRYPDSLNINKPVYLKRWPNFTRLVITPHALRISALLIGEPRTLMNVIDVLKIKPQYVFIFISAAHTLGLVGQTKHAVDVETPFAKAKPSKAKGLLGRILGRLRTK